MNKIKNSNSDLIINILSIEFINFTVPERIDRDKSF
jgi:hypothetical protein